MKAAFHVGAGELEIRDVPEPVPSDDQVLIQIRYCGLCGTDKFALMKSPNKEYIPGHECSGIVVDAKSDLSYKAGDHVTVNPVIGCGKCDACQRGVWDDCKERKVVAYGLPGAFAEYLAVPARNLWKKPENISDAEASLTEPLAVAVHGTDLADTSGKNVLVFGAGAIGLMVAQILVARGAKSVFITDINDDHLKIADQLGSMVPFRADHPDAWKTISETDIQIAFDVAGHSKVILDQAIETLITGGELVLIGVSEPEDLDAEKAQGKSLEILKSTGTTVEDFDNANRLLESGKVRCNPLISGIYPLDEINEALKSSLSGIKVLVECTKL